MIDFFECNPPPFLQKKGQITIIGDTERIYP